MEMAKFGKVKTSKFFIPIGKNVNWFSQKKLKMFYLNASF